MGLRIAEVRQNPVTNESRDLTALSIAVVQQA
jgi:hypothetical protein